MRVGSGARGLWWGLGLIAVGLGGVLLFHQTGPGRAPFSGWGSGGYYDKGTYTSNGERIYYLGIDSDGNRVKFRGGPHWFNAMGGSCVNCHGPDGRGGYPVMMGTKVPSDIRYNALSSGEHDHGEPGEEAVAYSDQDIRRAITEGLEPDGNRLDPTMPKFALEPEDLEDLLQFLKTLD